MTDNSELYKQEEQTVMTLPEIDMPAFLKKKLTTPNPRKVMAADLEIPPVEPDVPEPIDVDAPPATDVGGVSNSNEPTPAFDVNAPPPVPPVEDEDLKEKLQELEDNIQGLNIEVKLLSLKKEIMEEVTKSINKLREDIDNLKERKTPKREYYDTDGAYREHLYNMATTVLDKILPDLFNDIPDYSLIATQISRTFEDGTIADAIVTITVTVPRDGYRYDFKVDVPVLNGLMQYPAYIQRGLKIIPLTKNEIQNELDSVSYRKLDAEQPHLKQNIFNNIGENIHRREDKQKFYDVKPDAIPSVGMPPNNKLMPNRTNR